MGRFWRKSYETMTFLSAQVSGHAQVAGAAGVLTRPLAFREPSVCPSLRTSFSVVGDASPTSASCKVTLGECVVGDAGSMAQRRRQQYFLRLGRADK